MSRKKRKLNKIMINYLFLLPFLVFFIVFIIGPIFYAIYMSFYNWPILSKEHIFIGFENYRNLIMDSIWWKAIKNTFYFTFLTSLSTTIFSFLIAVSLNGSIKGQHLFRFIFYMPVVISVSAMGIIIGWTFNAQFGIVNYLLRFIGISGINWLGDKNLVIPTLAIASVWWGFGSPMLIFLAGLQNLPKQVYEAAEIDGASDSGCFFYITIPLMFPTIFFVLVTQLIAHFQVFGQSYLITGGGPGRESYTVIYYLYQTAWRYYKMGYGASIAITFSIIILLITLIQFKLTSKYNSIEY